MTLHALYRVADLVSRVHEPAAIYKPAVEAMIAATGADRASLLVLDEDGVMRFRAWHGLSDGYRAAVDGHSPWAPDSRDPAPLLIPDVAADRSLGPLQDVVLAEGIRALGFIPVGHHGRLLGKFMVYYDEPHEFSDLELKVAAMVAHYVAFGLDRVRAEAEISELLARERAARHEAEAANHAKDDFLAMLSHELRNPLNAIVHAVSVMDRAGDPVPARAQELIRRQTGHLARLLDDLLDAARVGRGHLEIRPEPVDVRSPARLAVEKLAHRFQEKRQTLHVSLPEQPVMVKGDPTRLQQVVANLLDNASKYTPAGGTIWLLGAVEDGEAVLTVRDTGPGIPADRLRSIFDPFTQINPTLARTSGGLGIGLSLVKRIVDLHRGVVEARSDHAGATFTVRLPIVAEIPAVPPEPEPPRAPVGRRVVVVEDNDDGREALCMALAARGVAVESASAGREGIELVLRGRPDFVLVDIGLPDLDGYEVARTLRRRLGPGVKLVALTGYGQEADRARSSAAGFDLHLVKPVSPDAVVRLLASTA
jgi:signal transduction histidine kinase/CheY-like chemotaxis protein